MSDLSFKSNDRFFAAFLRPAWVVMMVAQMLLGLALAITLIVKYYMLVIGENGCLADTDTLGNIIRCTATLEIIAHFVLGAAGFRFAAFMFEDRPRAMLGALMVAMAGVLLLYLSQLTHGASTWAGAVTLLVLMLGMGLIYFAQVVLRPRGKFAEKTPNKAP